MNSISKLEKNSNYLKVIWDDGEESKFNYLWLRDNCPTACLLYTSPSPRDGLLSRMPSSA